MNPWTKLECRHLANALKLDDEDQAEWLRRYTLIGGKPRLFSSSKTLSDLLGHVETDIPHDVDSLTRMVLRFEQHVFDRQMKHILFHFYRPEDDPSRSHLAYSSVAVEFIVSARYNIRSADQIRSLLRTSEAQAEPTLQAWRGKEIEKCLLATHKFCMKSLEGNVGALNAPSRIIQAVSDIQNGLILYAPLSKTFPAIDAVLVIPRETGTRGKKNKGHIIYVQSTVAESHPVKYQHLKKLKNVYLELKRYSCASLHCPGRHLRRIPRSTVQE